MTVFGLGLENVYSRLGAGTFFLAYGTTVSQHRGLFFLSIYRIIAKILKVSLKSHRNLILTIERAANMLNVSLNSESLQNTVDGKKN